VLAPSGVDCPVKGVAEACAVCRKALDAVDPTPWLVGWVVMLVFRRLA
jgi:glutamate-1-semialdehyde 2,1-aminomutase